MHSFCDCTASSTNGTDRVVKKIVIGTSKITQNALHACNCMLTRLLCTSGFTGILLVVARGEPNTARQVRWYVQYHLVVELVVLHVARQMWQDKCAGTHTHTLQVGSSLLHDTCLVRCLSTLKL
mgnify:CR=1 FL=1